MSDGNAQRDEDREARIAALEAELASVRLTRDEQAQALASVRRTHDQQMQARERAEHEREQFRKLYTLRRGLTAAMSGGFHAWRRSIF